MTCQETTLSLGVYLLGALEPAERAAVDAHLAHCADCQAQLADLAGLPSMLERLALADLESTLASHDPTLQRLTPSDDLFNRVAAQVREEQTDLRRVRFGRFQKLTAVAAGVVVLVGVGIGAVAISHHAGSHQLRVEGAQGPVHMQVEVAGQSSSTTLHVTVSGVPAEEHCQLIAYATDGTHEMAGQWDATYAGWADFTGSTSIPLERLSKLVLRGSNGVQLDTVTV
jgi:hypothetical protein